MLKPGYFIPIILGSFCLMQCADRQNDIPLPQTTFNLKLPARLPSVSLLGKWTYSFPFYYSELTINGDGTFKFYDEGCTRNDYTEGKWAYNGKTISLTSSKEYAIDTAPEPVQISPPVKKSKSTRKIRPGKLVYTFDTSFLNRPHPPLPGPGDTAKIYFDKVQLVYLGNSLFQLDKNGERTDTRFIFNGHGGANTQTWPHPPVSAGAYPSLPQNVSSFLRPHN